MPGTVIVASKLPHGLRLQLQREITYKEPFQGGLRDVSRHEHFGEVVVLNGAAVTPIHGGEHQIKGGYALTTGVDADFFDVWMKQNEDHPAVAGGFIFASAKMADVIDHTKAGKDELSGFEPTDPEKLPLEFRKTIKSADKAAA